MIDPTTAHDEIIAQLNTIQGIDVYRGQYVPGDAVPEQDANGLFKPYATVVFGGNYQGDSRTIASLRYNTIRTTCTVYVVAPDDRLSVEFLSKVRDKLWGFTPTDSTPLDIYGGYDYVDSDLGVNRYVHAQVFEFSTNMTY